VTVVAGVAAGKVGRVFAGCRDVVMTGDAGPQYLRVIDSDYRVPQVRGVAVLADIRRLNVRWVFVSRVRAVMAARTGAGNVVVIKIRRQPGDGTVTVVAIVAAGKVSRVFPACGDTVMAAATAAQNLRVIDGDCGRPYRRAVAVFADIRRLNVCSILAGRTRAVMAANTVAGDSVVIECCGDPGNRRVTIVTIVAAGNVGRVFPGRDCAVMTGAAGTQDLCVIDSERGRPYCRAVAILADIRSLNVCSIFAGCNSAVMAADTVAKNVHVIEICRRPRNCCVTVVAGVAAGNVGRVFPGCGDAVVATNAIAKNAGVIEDGGSPRDRVVAIVALVAGGDMGWRFPRRLDAVMAGNATTGYGGVIHKCDRAPACRDMTVRTFSCCHYMVGGF